jgi:hypothetical protein
MEKPTITRAFTLWPDHVAVIHQVAKDNGQSSYSAALRHIIEKFMEYERQQQQPGDNGQSVPVTS